MPEVTRITAKVDHVLRKAILIVEGTWCGNCDEEIHPRHGCPCRRAVEFKRDREAIESFVQENVESLAAGHRHGLKVAMGVQSSAITRAGRKAGRNALYQEGATLSQWDAKATRDDFSQPVRWFRPTTTEASPLPV